MLAVKERYELMELVNLPKKITLCEVGLRDGLQNEKKLLTVEQKVNLINVMSEAGVPVIEIGSFVSPKAVPQMANTDEVAAKITPKNGVEYRALIANVKGVERALACGCTKVKLNVSASISHNLANLNCLPAQSVARFAECVEKARDAQINISGSISMAFGSPWDTNITVREVRDIVEAYLAVGINEISLSDAAGMAYPKQVNAICREMLESYPNVDWWLHFHNTRGLGIANIFAGMLTGFTKFDASIAGVGGCPFVPGAAGNVATEDLIHMCDESDIWTGVDLDKLLDIGRQVVGLIGHSTDSYLLRAGKSQDLLRELPTGQSKNSTETK